MNITLAKVIVWLIVGGLAGSFAGMLVKRTKEGFGRWTNFGIGLVGAIIGGALFNLLKINLGLLGELRISFEELLAALVGSLILPTLHPLQIEGTPIVTGPTTKRFLAPGIVAGPGDALVGGSW
jgi:uncharacterized membrane protein YeaQ/YmgE (transglycosylase-associated protein family)